MYDRILVSLMQNRSKEVVSQLRTIRAALVVVPQLLLCLVGIVFKRQIPAILFKSESSLSSVKYYSVLTHRTMLSVFA